MNMGLYGQVVTGADVRKAMLDTLQVWLPHTLHEVHRQAAAGVPAEPLVRTWGRPVAPGSVTVDQFPAVFVTSPGLEGSPQRSGRGPIRARWRLVCTAVVTDMDYDRVADRAAWYAAAIRLAAVQQPTLGIDASTEWVGEDYEALGLTPQSRTMAAVFVDFVVGVDAVVDPFGGPRHYPEPVVVPADPVVDPGDFPSVETIDITVTAPIEEP